MKKRKEKKAAHGTGEMCFFFQRIVNALLFETMCFLILIFGWMAFCLGNWSHFDLSFLLGQPVKSVFLSYGSDLFRILLFD